MSVKQLDRPYWYVAWALVLLTLVGCAGDPDQAQLEQTIASAQANTERGEMGQVMALVTEDFAGQGGQYDRLMLRRMLLAVRLRHSDVNVSRVSTEFEMGQSFATVKMKLLLTGGSGGLLPETGRLMDLQTRWRVEDGEWRLTSADWDRSLGL